MDVNEIIQIIGSLGFPIVAACGMFYLYDKTIKDLTVTLARIDTTLTHMINHMEGGAEHVHTAD